MLVDAAYSDQEQRCPAAHQSAPPPLWVVRVASRLGVARLFSQAVYRGTQPADTINLLNNAYLPISLPSAVEEQQQRSFLLAEARRVTPFGHLPLIVLTGTSPTRYNEYADKALRQQVTQTWRGCSTTCCTSLPRAGSSWPPMLTPRAVVATRPRDGRHPTTPRSPLNRSLTKHARACQRQRVLGKASKFRPPIPGCVVQGLWRKSWVRSNPSACWPLVCCGRG